MAIALETATAAQESGIRGTLGAHPRGDYFYDIVDYTTALQRDGTDDATTGFQTALTAIETAMLANNGGRYALWLGDAILKITGALQTTNGNNAQLMLPAVALTDHQCTLEIRGAAAVSSGYSVIGGVPVPTKGAIIRSTLATGGGTRPCVLGGKAPTGAAIDFSIINLFLINVEIQTVENPLISGLDATYLAGLEMINSSVTTGVYSVDDLTTPTTATSYGIIGPTINNGVYSNFHNAATIGFYTGFKLNEHSTGDLQAFGCLTAVEVGAAYHGSTMTRIGSVHCKTVLRAPTSVGSLQSARWNVDLLMIEHAASGPFVPVNDIEDANNHLKGQCNYAVVLENSGESSVFVKSGGTNFQCRALGDNIVPVWSALSGTTPALTFVNTPKISTLTMSGNTTFSSSGYEQGREYTVYLTGATSTRTLTFPGWTWGGTAPADIAATETIKIQLVCTGSTTASVFATFSEGTTATGSGYTITDAFTRADNASAIGTSTSGHTPTVRTATWGIISNTAYISAVPGANTHFVTWDNGSADATVEVTLNTPASGNFGFGLVLRYQDLNNNLVAEMADNGSITLYKTIAGVSTVLGSATAQGYTNSQTHTLKVVMAGTAIEVFVGGVSKFTYNTTTGFESYTPHGLHYYASTVSPALGTFDNFSITTP